MLWQDSLMLLWRKTRRDSSSRVSPLLLAVTHRADHWGALIRRPIDQKCVDLRPVRHEPVDHGLTHSQATLCPVPGAPVSEAPVSADPLSEWSLTSGPGLESLQKSSVESGKFFSQFPNKIHYETHLGSWIGHACAIWSHG
jgi:hypothetical protein